MPMASSQLPSARQRQLTNENAKIRVEFAININKQDDLAKIDDVLRGKGVKLLSADFKAKTIQLELGDETNGQLGNVQTLQRFIEKQTGILTIVKGLGEVSSAVAELSPAPVTLGYLGSPQHVVGVIHLCQLVDGRCFVDGALFKSKEGDMTPGRHYSLAIHECGDLSENSLESIGKPILVIDNQLQVDEQQDQTTRSISVRKIVPDCDVLAMIGRSVAVTELRADNRDDSSATAGRRILSAGVIARASTIGSNKKQICTCSGKNLWEERLDRKRKEEDQL